MSIFTNLTDAFGYNRVKQNEPLEKYLIRKAQTKAEYFLETDSLDELNRIVSLARKLKLRMHVLGGGSGLQIDSEKIDGLVVRNNCHRFHSMDLRGKSLERKLGVNEVLVYAESGVLMNQLVRFTIEESLEGLEYQLGLPGTVGGAMVTNAKYEPKYIPVRKAVQSIKILHLDGQIQNYMGELPFFVQTDDGWEQTQDVILSVVFRLLPSDKNRLWEKGNEATNNRKETYNISET